MKSNKYRFYEKIVKVINSCTNEDQLEVAETMFYNAVSYNLLNNDQIREIERIRSVKFWILQE